MTEAKRIFHHDDPPCAARLNADGTCPECRLHPDTQSKCIRFYCPTCDAPLKDMTCPRCGKRYEIPGR